MRWAYNSHRWWDFRHLKTKDYWSLMGWFYWTRIDRGQQEAWTSDFK